MWRAVRSFVRPQVERAGQEHPEQRHEPRDDLQRVLAQEVQRRGGVDGQRALRHPGGHLALRRVLHAAVQHAQQACVGGPRYADAHGVRVVGDGGDGKRLVLRFGQQVVRHVRVGVGCIGGARQHGIDALLRRVEVQHLVPHVLALHLGGQGEAPRQGDARAFGGGVRPHDEGHGVAQVGAGGGHDALRGLVGVAVHAGHEVHLAALHHGEGVVVAVDGHELEREARHARDVLEQPCRGAVERARLGVGVGQRHAERVVGHPQRGRGCEVGVLVLGEHGILVGVDAENNGCTAAWRSWGRAAGGGSWRRSAPAL